MDKQNFDKVMQLNAEFYETVGDEFDGTRQNPWEGWKHVMMSIQPFLRHSTQIKVLDLGCGNGRFLSYIERLDLPIKYLGIDASEKLLSKTFKSARADFAKVEFIKNLYELHGLGTFDLIVAFGVTHHIPDKVHRKRWFLTIANLINQGGFLIFSTWNFSIDKAVMGPFEEDFLEENDYLLGWGDTGALRFCHYYTEEEINQLIKELKDTGLHLLKTFEADGSTNQKNKYYVLRKG
ncbi:MAG: class I SAM-dependent methyltransferase [Patescibacteria group bacterium]